MINALKVLAMLAWRNLWRNHRRTFIMLAAIGFGTWAMIFMTALTQGMVNEMIKDGISALPGHVQVHHPDYRDDRDERIPQGMLVQDNALFKPLGPSRLELVRRSRNLVLVASASTLGPYADG